MSCYHPLIGIDNGYNDDGKRDIVVLPNGAVTLKYQNTAKRYFDIPCGHCIGCRQSQSREWANRLIMESLYHDFTHFITLTYCDEYMPYSDQYYVNDSTGEIQFAPTLKKSDIQNFMKRLRFNFKGHKIRFYIAGEYGDQTHRPHYHGILFGLPENEMELIPCGRSETGNPYFRCPQIENAWKVTKESGLPLGCNAQAAKRGLDPNLIGFVSVEPANWFTMKYVTSYVTKKLGEKPNQVYTMRGQVPPFSLSSRRPGIGLQYLEDHPEVMEQDKIILAGPNGKVEFSPPRYFKKKYAAVDPQLLDDLAERHLKAAADKVNAELSKTDLDYQDYLNIKENNHLSKLKNRNKI